MAFLRNKNSPVVKLSESEKSKFRRFCRQAVIFRNLTFLSMPLVPLGMVIAVRAMQEQWRSPWLKTHAIFLLTAAPWIIFGTLYAIFWLYSRCPRCRSFFSWDIEQQAGVLRRTLAKVFIPPFCKNCGAELSPIGNKYSVDD